MAIMKKSNKEDAVSPVIGVMLMLVVTIVIAAVVAAFASGLGGDVESAPAAIMDVDLTTTKATLQHLSGENLLIQDLRIKVQKDDGTLLKEGTFETSDEKTTGFFTPGMTISSELDGTGTIKSGDYVKVIILYDGKHVILNKDIMVK